MKKKIFKYLGLAAAVLVLLAFALLLALRVLFPPEQVRRFAESRLSALTGRACTVGSVGYSIFPAPAVGLSGLVIAEDPGYGNPYFCRVENIYLRIRLLPLLSRRVEVGRLAVVWPEVYLAENSAGKLNTATLFPADTLRAAADTAAGAGPQFSLVLHKVAVSGGTLHYASAKEAQRLTLSPVDLQLSLERRGGDSLFGLALDAGIGGMEADTSGFLAALARGMPLELSSQGGVNLKSGKVDLSRITVSFAGLEVEGSGLLADYRADPLEYSLDWRTREVDLVQVLGLVPSSWVPVNRVSKVSGRVELSGTLAGGRPGAGPAPAYTVKAVLEGVEARLEGLERPVRELGSQLTLDRERLVLEKLKLRFGDDPLEASGTLSLAEGNPYSLKVDGSLGLEDLPRLLQGMEDLSTSGRLEADLSLKGSLGELSRLTAQGTLGGKDLMLSGKKLAKTIAIPEMRLEFKGRDLVRAAASVAAGSSLLRLEGSLKNFASLFDSGRQAAAAPYWQAKLSGPYLSLADFLPADTGETPAARPAGSPREKIPPGEGSVELDRLIVSDTLTLEQVRMKISLRDDLLTIDPLEAGLCSGSLAARGKVRFAEDGPLQSAFEVEVSQVEAGQVLKPYTPFARYLFGKISLKASLEGSGSDTQQIIQSLSAAGSYSVADGQVRGWPVLGKVAGFTKIKELDPLAFLDWSGELSIREGRVYTESVAIETSQALWNLGGSYGFDGSLDYAVQLTLNQELSQKYLSELPVNVASFLGDDNKRLAVAFKVSGTTDDPSIKWDSKPLVDKAVKKIETKLKSQLNKLTDRLFGRKSAATETPAADSAAADTSAKP
ncbi:MAG: AsmA family protein [Candidatus Glassbacteria bacterium]|nr:AsmA family protein [Candidatus Glassbacteria bacterium]